MAEWGQRIFAFFMLWHNMFWLLWPNIFHVECYDVTYVMLWVLWRVSVWRFVSVVCPSVSICMSLCDCPCLVSVCRFVPACVYSHLSVALSFSLSPSLCVCFFLFSDANADEVRRQGQSSARSATQRYHEPPKGRQCPPQGVDAYLSKAHLCYHCKLMLFFI